MKTIKDLRKKLTNKIAGVKYTYEINNTKYNIYILEDMKSWCLNTIENGELVDAYGYKGLRLKDCKDMILMSWNSNEIV